MNSTYTISGKLLSNVPFSINKNIYELTKTPGKQFRSAMLSKEGEDDVF